MNTLYDTGDDSFVSAVSALDGPTGRVRWTREADRLMAPALTVADGVVFCGMWRDDGSFFTALDVDSGEALWEHRRAADGDPSRGEATTIAVADGTAYFGDSDGKLHAFDARRGTPLWSFAPDVRIEEWLEPVVVADGVVLGATGDGSGTGGPGEVHAVAADSGEPLWTEPTEDEPLVHAPLDGAALYSVATGTLHALDLRTGESPTETRLSTGNPDPAVVGDRVYFDGGDGRLRAGGISLGGG
ncbi:MULTISPECIES: PQQ-binding-like beta-propeller repeat protein [Streptomyces]|uniref:PQQ-binding-like beta-propeller repeat protein n=1 Tax=Streptomyces TaxID=1883 RepID=UPI00186AC8DF|nr:MULTISPECIES: PQQ-binding-like beta-propeller repeat protein [Streptomyces]